MSDNVSSIKLIEGQLKAKALDAFQIQIKQRHWIPESNFLQQIARKATDLSDDIVVNIESGFWCGEGSGYGFNCGAFTEAIKCLTGHAKIAMIFDSGDIVGLEIKDGVAHLKRVRIVLED